MRNLIMAALLVLFSINGVASAAAAAEDDDDIFEIETEGSYRMVLSSSVDLAKKVALFTAKRKAIEDNKQEQKEAQESYQEEMEQPISAEIDPGRDIAKAYRLMREKKWRITMIYLNHLEKKYPNWDSIYMAQAITHYILHEPVFMKKALNEACRLGNSTACDDLKNLKKVHKHDFGF